jgi:hypothetical protein
MSVENESTSHPERDSNHTSTREDIQLPDVSGCGSIFGSLAGFLGGIILVAVPFWQTWTASHDPRGYRGGDEGLVYGVLFMVYSGITVGTTIYGIAAGFIGAELFGRWRQRFSANSLQTDNHRMRHEMIIGSLVFGAVIAFIYDVIMTWMIKSEYPSAFKYVETFACLSEAMILSLAFSVLGAFLLAKWYNQKLKLRSKTLNPQSSQTE